MKVLEGRPVEKKILLPGILFTSQEPDAVRAYKQRLVDGIQESLGPGAELGVFWSTEPSNLVKLCMISPVEAVSFLPFNTIE